jgi:hypothetical protein
MEGERGFSLSLALVAMNCCVGEEPAFVAHRGEREGALTHAPCSLSSSVDNCCVRASYRLTRRNVVGMGTADAGSRPGWFEKGGRALIVLSWHVPRRLVCSLSRPDIRNELEDVSEEREDAIKGAAVVTYAAWSWW